jgi:hypothetical protein
MTIRYCGSPSEFGPSGHLPAVGELLVHRDETAWTVDAIHPDTGGDGLVIRGPGEIAQGRA